MSSKAVRLEVVPPARDFSDMQDASVPLSAWPHFVRLIGGNGGKLLTSETYSNKANAVRAANTVKRTLGIDIPVVILDREDQEAIAA